MSTALSTIGERLQASTFLGRERPDGQGARDRRLIEGAVLVILGLLLLAATVNEVVKQSHVNERIAVDKRTWINYTGHRLKHVSVTPGLRNSNDTACAPPTAGAHERLCLQLTGPAHATYRTVTGGYRLPLLHPNRFRYRYGCFGAARRHRLCVGRAAPLQ